jgi:hypothetical protein
VNNYENNLKKTHNNRVDEDANPHAFDAFRSAKLRSGGAGSSRWLIPLMAAAAMVAAPIGASAAVNTTSATHRVAPAAPRPAQKATPKSSTTSTTTLATHRPVVVKLGGASLTLPFGWVARNYSLYQQAGEGTLAARQWCLTPSQLPASTKLGACPLTLGTIDRTANRNPVDVDTEGGWSSNPSACSEGVYPTGTRFSEATGDRTFGGRAADWRRWTYTCANGTQHLVEQYVVASGPGFILASDQASTKVHDAMTEITTHSTLPPRTSALRYMDRGYIRSIKRTSAGVQIRLDRAVRTPHRILNTNPATYPYLIPTRMFNQAHLVVGSLGSLFTNGTTVTQIYKTP